MDAIREGSVQLGRRHSGRRAGSTSRAGWIAALMASVLVVAGCSAGSDTPGGTSGPTPTQSASVAPAAGLPTKVFTDEELMALVNRVAEKRGLPYAAQDTQRLRIAFTTNPAPTQTTAVAPGECQTFVERDMQATAADKSVNFAMGAIGPAGTSGGPTSTVMFTVRSAARDALRTSQFAYSDEVASSCRQFDVTYTEGSGTLTSGVQMLQAPQIGEKAFATLRTPKPRNPGDMAGTGLAVLAGTLSITLSLSVASDADAQTAVDSMAGVARELIDQAASNAPTVSAPAPNSRTPEQLASLLKGIAGPGGSTPMVQAQLVRSPGATSAPDRCTYDDAAYLSGLAGSSMATATFSGSVKSWTTLTVISMAESVTPPYPFDGRASALRDCPSITENVLPGAHGRPWSSIQQLAEGPGGDAAYALTYRLSDGTGEIHVIMGARRGTVTVEATDLAHSDGEVQALANGLVALINQVFSAAGLP